MRGRNRLARGREDRSTGPLRGRRGACADRGLLDLFALCEREADRERPALDLARDERRTAHPGGRTRLRAQAHSSTPSSAAETRSATDQTVLETPLAIAGVQRIVEWIFTKL